MGEGGGGDWYRDGNERMVLNMKVAADARCECSRLRFNPEERLMQRRHVQVNAERCFRPVLVVRGWSAGARQRVPIRHFDGRLREPSQNCPLETVMHVARRGAPCRWA